jgi:hypothetical protein
MSEIYMLLNQGADCNKSPAIKQTFEKGFVQREEKKFIILSTHSLTLSHTLLVFSFPLFVHCFDMK